MEHDETTRIRHWPFVSFFIVTILALGTLYSTHFEERAHQAVLNTYLKSGLFSQEKAAFIDFYGRKVRVDLSEDPEAFSYLFDALESPDSSHYAWLLLNDRVFVQFLETEAPRFWQTETYLDWQENRGHIAHLSQTLMPSLRFGIDPHAPVLFRFASSLFMEHDWRFALVSLPLLFVVLWFIEIQLGRKSMPFWLITGVLISGVSFLGFASEGARVGMGSAPLLASSFGLLMSLLLRSSNNSSRHHFVFWAAPCLASITWLGHMRLADYMAWSSPAEQYAQVLAAVLLFVLGFSARTQDSRSSSAQIDQGAETTGANYRQALNAVYAAMSVFRLNRAKRLLLTVKSEFSSSEQACRQAFVLEKLSAKADDLESAIEDYAEQLVKSNNYYKACELLTDLQRISNTIEHKNKLDKLNCYPKLLRIFSEHADSKRSHQVLKLMHASELPQEAVLEASDYLSRSGLLKS